MRQAADTTGTFILSIFATGVFLLGLLTFLFAMTAQATTLEGDWTAQATPESAIDPTLPTLPAQGG